MMTSSREEIVVPFPAPEHTLGVATSVRTTLVVSSLQSLRQRGLADAYFAKLPAEHHEAIQSMIAGDWIPMSLARVHYDACEALGLGERGANEIGREVGHRVEGTFLAAMVRMAKSVGATPWIALEHVDKLYARLLLGGGGTCVVRTGPKDARVTMTGLDLVRVPYFRAAMAGVFEIGVELFCTRAHARVVADRRGAPRANIHVSWA